MEFSFENHVGENPIQFTAPALDFLFGISQLDPATYQLPPAVAEATSTSTVEIANSPTTPSGKQKKGKKRRSIDPSKPYPMIKCNECPKTYRDNAAGQRNLDLHMTTHDPQAQAKFTCEKCAKNFSNEVFYKRHMNLCGVPRKRRSSVGSSTHDESSSDSAGAFVVKKLDQNSAAVSTTVACIHEEPKKDEVQIINFNAF